MYSSAPRGAAALPSTPRGTTPTASPPLGLLDVPAPNPHLTAAEAPDAAWDHPINVERVDSFHGAHVGRATRSLGDVLVTVVMDAGQSDAQDQRFWKRSPLSDSNRRPPPYQGGSADLIVGRCCLSGELAAKCWGRRWGEWRCRPETA